MWVFKLLEARFLVSFTGLFILFALFMYDKKCIEIVS